MHLGGGFEENILAFIDAFNEKGISEVNEDGISFIEAVRSSSLVPENGACPTKKMYEAIFCLMKEGRSVELIMASFMLLKELDKCFPFVEFSNVDGDSDTSGNNEGWCPFILNVPNGEKKTAWGHPDGIFDSLGSRKIIFKALIKDCLAILCFISNQLSENIFHPRDSLPLSPMGSNHSLFLALLELVTSTPPAIQNFLVMIMELDAAKKTADMSGQTSRADGLRSQLLDIILDEFTYNKDILVRFLEAFNEPKWKLQVVFQYFSKYNYKASLRSRKPDDCHTDEMTPAAFLKYFSSTLNTRNMVKKMGCEEVQLLITHTFKACMSLSLKKDTCYNITPQMCNDLISAFHSLKKLNSYVEILPIGIEAVFMAVTALEKVGETKGV